MKLPCRAEVLAQNEHTRWTLTRYRRNHESEAKGTERKVFQRQLQHAQKHADAWDFGDSGGTSTSSASSLSSMPVAPLFTVTPSSSSLDPICVSGLALASCCIPQESCFCRLLRSKRTQYLPNSDSLWLHDQKAEARKSSVAISGESVKITQLQRRQHPLRYQEAE